MKHNELASVSRKDFFRDSLNRNDKLRGKAAMLPVLGLSCVIIAAVTIVVGMYNSYELYRDVSYISLYYAWLVALIACAIRCFTLPAKLRREADSLDYQLMAAFPDWEELVKGE